MRNRADLISIGIVLVFGILVIRETDHGTFDGVEAAFARWLAANSRSSLSAAKDAKKVLLVEINDETLHEVGSLSLLDHASFLKSAALLKPALVAIADPIDSRAAGEIERRAFETAAIASSQLLLAAMHERAEAPIALDLPGLIASEGDVSAIEPLGPPRPDPLLDSLSAIATVGPVLPPRTASVFRPRALSIDAPIAYATSAGLVASYTLRAIMLAHRVAPSEVLVIPGKHVLLGNLFAIPIGPDGSTTLPNPDQGGFRRMEFGDFLVAMEKGPDSLPRDLIHLRDGVILLGRTDEAARRIPVGIGRKISNAEMTAAALVLLDPLHPDGKHLHFAGWILLALAIFLHLRLRTTDKGAAALICLLFAAAYPVVGIALFEHFRIIIPLSPAYALIVFVLAGRLVRSPGLQQPQGATSAPPANPAPGSALSRRLSAPPAQALQHEENASSPRK